MKVENVRLIKKNKKIKRIILVVLLLMAISLWTKLLFFNDNSKKVVEDTRKKEVKKEVEVAKKDNKKDDFDIFKLYGIETVARKSPFINPHHQAKAEFNYQRVAKKEKLAQEIPEHRIREKLDFKLLGLLNNRNDAVALIYDGKRNYFLKKGDKIKGFVISKIIKDKVILKKNSENYSLKIID